MIADIILWGSILLVFYFFVWAVCVIAGKEDDATEEYWKEYWNMSDNNRTKEEYLERFARDYCDGDIEKAKENAIVKEVLDKLED